MLKYENFYEGKECLLSSREGKIDVLLMQYLNIISIVGVEKA